MPRTKLNNGLCADCGINTRASWSKSYCAKCATNRTVTARNKRMKQLLQDPPRVGICLKCKEEKELYTPMIYYCKACSWEFAKKTEKTYRDKKWNWLRALKEDQPCVICGRKEAYYNMHWHHREPDKKDFNMGAAVRIGYDRIRKELEKCDLLCALCHGDETHKQRQIK